MIIVGINSGEDGWGRPIDSGGAAIVADGRIVAAVAEERVARRKHAGGYRSALDVLLRGCGLGLSDVDRFLISFYGCPLDRLAARIQAEARRLELPDGPARMRLVPSHHLSHAVASVFLSPFDRALVVVADNEGSVLQPGPHEPVPLRDLRCERQSYYYAEGNRLTLIDRDCAGPNEVGLGRAYNHFTRYVGLGDYHAAGKLMGLSSYGARAPWMDAVDLWSAEEGGALAPAGFRDSGSVGDVQRFLEDRGVRIPPPGDRASWREQRYRDLALYAQHQLEKWLTRRVASLLDRLPDCQAVCLGGGVALNSAANSRLESALGVRVFVPPYPSDEGQALGNAIFGFIHEDQRAETGREPIRFEDSTYLGPAYLDRDHEAATGGRDGWKAVSDQDATRCAAQSLAGGMLLGWFQGRSEYGARALGNRSVLADPRRASVRGELNARKGREPFRPFAPAVLAHRTDRYFEPSGSLLTDRMLAVSTARPEAITKAPAIVHVDGTARVQTVTSSANRPFFRLIEEFERLTGLPLVLNTSFNFAGNPIVETPIDAIEEAERIGLDVLVLDNLVMQRRTQGHAR